MTPKHSVLISYSNNDRLLAERVLQALKAKNISCWIAFENIRTGESWPAAITEAISHCEIFLLILTKSSNGSRQVIRELSQADNLNKKLYCFQVEDISISSEMQYFFSSIHRQEAFKSNLETSLVKMTDEITSRLSMNADEAIMKTDEVNKQKQFNETEHTEKGFQLKALWKRNKRIIFAFRILCISIALMLISFAAWQFFKPNSNVVRDIDGNIYKTVKIGKQIWMAENLNVSRFKNGDPIHDAKTDEQWIKAGEIGRPAWCYNNNDSTTSKEYGRLYNWYTANDPRGLAPEGWHIPSDDEWTELIGFLGGDSIAGGKMKAITTWYPYPNVGATNSSGFTAPGTGYRTHNAIYVSLGRNGVWWSATPDEGNYANYALRRDLYVDNAIITRGIDDKRLGGSIRCIKN